jgi:hypothetical protein
MTTPAQFTDFSDVHDPRWHVLAWLLAVAQRRQIIDGQLEVVDDETRPHRREALVTEHAHAAVEDPRFDHWRVVSGLHNIATCRTAVETRGEAFAVELALFRVARSLLDRLTRS